MLPFERETAELFRELAAHDRAQAIEQFRSLASANQYRLLYELTARFVPAGAAVLDWGCGRGHFSYYLVKRGFRVTGYSIEEQPEIFGALGDEERSRLAFVRGADPVTMPLPAGAFDAAFSVGVLEHVRETGGTEEHSLSELRRLLVPGGLLIVYHFPNRHSYIEALARLIYGHRHRDVVQTVTFHKHLFSASDIAHLLGNSGFSLVELGRYGLLPRNSFNRLPRNLRSRQRLASVVNLADLLLERLCSPIVQNFYFVARADPA